eukprot:TRINITY_DN411_c0_g1_i1.p1 TRINITY_DN411_c0_g1~~TRINITY_DN411_c0_g1_i1.p1  ORF type:complete len:454 (+),score=193.38 TRINITY_DN411_c0_g1_i1:133-1494(+)
MRISQLFILSPRGDKIIAKDYRCDVMRTTDEVFFRKYRFWDGPGGGDAPPFFTVDGIHYAFMKKNNLLLVLTTRTNASPSLLAELLVRLTKLLKDYLGVLNEDNLRKNFVLVYELLDEIIDFGYLQGTSTEKLVPYIFNEPIKADAAAKKPAQGSSTSVGVIGKLTGKAVTKQAADAQKSVISKSGDKEGRKNEVFVDVLERLNAVFNSNGTLVNQEINGAIIMKSFLVGTPNLRLGLNEDLVVGRDSGSYGGVVLDSVNFHECINHSEFDSERTLVFNPPDGEFVVMNYRMTGTDHIMPFRISPSMDTPTPYQVELTLRVRADFPGGVTASSVLVKFAVPRATTSVKCDLGAGAVNQTYEYKQADKCIVWLMKKFAGGTEQVCRAKMSFSQPVGPGVRREIGPISMNFEIPMFVVSGLGIRFLRIEERSKSYNPQRWVRNITQANSYICRMT